MNNNFEVTFTAKSPCNFTGSFFRRKRFEPFVFGLITQYLPSPLEYPVEITIYGDKLFGIKTIKFSNQAQCFKFTEPHWEVASYAFKSISVEEFNTDLETKKILHIFTHELSYFAREPTKASINANPVPFQNFSLIFKEMQINDARRITTYKELLYQICNFLENNPNFTYFDVVKNILASLGICIEDIDTLQISGVIDICHGKLVSACSYFDGAVVELYFENGEIRATCRTNKSICTVHKHSNSKSIRFDSDIQDNKERDAEQQSCLEKIAEAEKYCNFIPTN